MRARRTAKRPVTTTTRKGDDVVRVKSITVLRIREGITDPDDIIPDRGDHVSFAVRVKGHLLGTLYVKRQRAKVPNWLRYFDGAVDLADLELRVSSSAALLLVKRDGAMFAVIFGYGRWMLADTAIDERFGLRVTLNAIEATLIRSMDHRRVDAVARSTREQVSRASSQHTFGLDVQRDLLRAVTGRPADPTLGSQLTGSDQLSVVGNLPLAALGEQLDRYHTLASQTSYRENFAWVDNIAEIPSGALRRDLDEALARELRTGTLERVCLGVPEILDWGAFAGFQYRRHNSDNAGFAELSLEDYFATARARDDVTIDTLRADRVYFLNAEESDVRKVWPLHKCLIAEFVENGDTYILSEGKWYRVSASFLADVEAFVRQLRPTTVSLPRYAHKNEKNYNQKVAERSAGYLCLLDRDPIATGSRGSVESCDLYSRDRHLIHVKRYGASSHLSHLFSQGVVSAEMFAQDRHFRVKFNEKLPASHRMQAPEEMPVTSDFEIAYAIVKPRGREFELPFFSKVNLRNAAGILGRLGFRVTFTVINS